VTGGITTALDVELKVGATKVDDLGVELATNGMEEELDDSGVGVGLVVGEGGGGGWDVPGAEELGGGTDEVDGGAWVVGEV
jgi:hypothetical protein